MSSSSRNRLERRSDTSAPGAATTNQIDNTKTRSLAGGLISSTPTRTNQIGNKSGVVQGDRVAAESANGPIVAAELYGSGGGAGQLVEANKRQFMKNSTSPKLSWYKRLVEAGGGKSQNSIKSSKANNRRGSIIAHASSNFVDKLTYMIKKSNKITRSDNHFGADGTEPVVRQTSIERNREAVEPQLAAGKLEPRRASGSGGAVADGNTISNSGSSHNNNNNNNNNRYHLISELSRRLVRRCKECKAVQFAARQCNNSRPRSGSAQAPKSEIVCQEELTPPSEQPPNDTRDTGGSLARLSRNTDGGAASLCSRERSSESETQAKITTTTSCLGMLTADSHFSSTIAGSSPRGGGGGSSSMAVASLASPQGADSAEQEPCQWQSCEPQSQTQSRSDKPMAQTQTFTDTDKQQRQQQQQEQPLAPNQTPPGAATPATNNLKTSSSNPKFSSNSTLTSTGTTNATTAGSACGCLCHDESSSSGFISNGLVCSTLDSITITSCSSSSSTNYNDHQAPDSADRQQQQHHQLTPPPTASATTSSYTNSGSATSARGKVPSFFASTVMMIETKQQGSPQVSPNMGRQHAENQANNNNNNNSGGGQQEEGAGKKGSASSTTSSTSGGSFLSRARNSTINLASLATVTHRFNCSASVGNLWSSYGGNQQQRRELAELSGDSRDVKPLDYIAHGAFDQYDHLNDSACSTQINNNNNNNNSEPEGDSKGSKSCNKSAGTLFSIGSAPVSRKSSSKEKKKRQKDAEKVEKLRLLVSYLKSGTSQPLLKPVTLEADEIELALKYKLHLILCEDCLQQVEVEQQQQQQLLQHQKPRTGLTCSASTGSILGSGPVTRAPGSWSPVTGDQSSMGASGQPNTIAGIVINVRRSSEQLMTNNNSTNNINNNNCSSPTLAVPNNLGVGHSLNSASSPTIDEHNSSTCSSNSSNNSDNSLHQHHFLNDPQDHDTHSDYNHPHPHQNHNHLPDSGSQASSQQQNHNYQQRQQLQPQVAGGQQHSQQLLCYKCKKPTGRSMSSIMSSADLTATASVASDIDSNLSSSFNNQEPYGAAASDAQLPSPLFDHNNSTNNSNNNIYSNFNHHHQTPGYNQSTNTTSVLATWIDNEVNSLVNDLEAKSQLVREEKYAKSSGKRKWLSSGSSRRNSSGAHST